MKKRILSALVSVALIASQASPALASEDAYVIAEELSAAAADAEGEAAYVAEETQEEDPAPADLIPAEEEETISATADDEAVWTDEADPEEDLPVTNEVEEAEELPEEDEELLPADIPEAETDAVPEEELLPVGADGIEAVEYHNFGNRALLRGWDQWVNRYDQSVNVLYTDGRDEWYGGIEVLSVSAVAEEGDDSCFRIEERDDGWSIRAEEPGVVKVTVTYKGWEDTADATEEFRLYIGEDIYNVWMETDDGSSRALAGQEIHLSARTSHEVQEYDENGNPSGSRQDEDESGYRFEWTLRTDEVPEELRGAFAQTVDEDGKGMTVRFGGFPEGWDNTWQDIRVELRLFDEDEEKAGNEYRLSFSESYAEVWPTELADLEPGSSREIHPEIRFYPGADGAEYDTAADGDVHFRWYYDKNCVEIKDASGNIVGEHDDDGNYRDSDDSYKNGAAFTIRRIGNWYTDIELKAELKNEYGDFEEVDNRRFVFDDRNYDIWFDTPDGDQVYSDGTRTFALNTDNLESIKGKYTMDVTAGVWDGDKEQFTDTLSPGSGWSFDEKKGALELDGAKLDALGIERLEVRVRVMLGDTEIGSEQRGFDVREARQGDLYGDETLFVGDENWIAEDNGSRVNMEDSTFPGGWWRYRITKLELVSDEDPYDSRGAVEAVREEDGWTLRAVRGGEATLTLTAEVYDEEDKSRTETITRTYTLYVGGFRANMWLKTEGGQENFLPGASIAVAPEYAGETYNWENGDREQVDTGAWKVEYEARCEWIDDNFAQKNGGDYDALMAEGKYWSKKVRGDGALVVSAAADAPDLDIRVEARLFDEEGNEIQYRDITLFVSNEYYAVEAGDWDPDMPVGATATLAPKLMHYAKGGATDVTEELGVQFYFDWHEGNGPDSDNPSHVVITDADGKVLTMKDDEGRTGKAPFTVQRIVDWDGTVNVEGWYTERGEERWLNQALALSRSETEVRLVAEGAHTSDEEGYVRYYLTEDGDKVTAEPVRVVPEISEVEALQKAGYPVEVSLTAGHLEWDGEMQKRVMQPIKTYEILENGERGEETGEWTFASSELSADRGLVLTDAERIRELRTMLDYQDGYGDGMDLLLTAGLNGREIARYEMRVSIRRNEVRLEDDWATTLPGHDFYYTDSKASLYVEDAEHADGNERNDESGSYYEVTITKIESDNLYVLKPEEEDGDWYIRAIAPGDAWITYTYTGGPDGGGTHVTNLHVAEDYYYLITRDEDGSERDYYRRLLGTTGTIRPVVVHEHYDAASGEITKEEIARDRLDCRFDWDDHRIELDESTGVFKVLETGDSDIYLDVEYREGDDVLLREGRNYHVNGCTSLGKLDIDDAAVLYVSPGETLSIADLKAHLPEKIKVLSLKDASGTDVPVTEYWFDYAGRSMTLSGGKDGHCDTLSVDEEALTGGTEEDGTVKSELGIGARDADWNDGYDVLTVVIHEHKAERIAAKAATCTETGLTEGTKCSVCGAILTAQKTVPATGHVWDAGVVTKEPTALSEGVRTYTCRTNAAHKKTEKIAKLAPVLKLNVSGTVPLQKGKTSKGVKVTEMASGDYVASAVSGNTKIVKAAVSGSTIKLTGKKTGTATVTVTLASGISKSFKVKVQTKAVKTKKIGGLKKTVSMKAKESLALKPVVTPVTTLDKLKYKSSNKKVAKVSGKGVIKAVKKGTAKITVTSGKKKYVITVKVS